MKSVRLDPLLEERLKQAATVRGESLSEFIRRAAAERADATLNTQPDAQWSDVLGVVRGGGKRARRTGETFAAEVVRRAAK